MQFSTQTCSSKENIAKTQKNQLSDKVLFTQTEISLTSLLLNRSQILELIL